MQFRTLIAVGYIFLKSSSLSIVCQEDLCDFHLSARASHAEGTGPEHQREGENLKQREEGETRECVSALKCGGRALTGLTHALTLTALGEENRSSYPRGPRGEKQRGGGGGG